LPENKSNREGLKLNPVIITGIISLLILGVILIRFTTFTYGMPNEIFSAINISLVLICFSVIVIIDKSVISLIALPLICSLTIFISSAVHNFEFHRGAIFNTFLSQLFYMYIFRNLNFKYSKISFNILFGFTILMAVMGLIFILSGTNYFLGVRVYLARDVLRSPTVLFSNGAYMGYFVTFVLAVIFFTKKVTLKSLPVILILSFMLLISGNRTALFGLLLMILMYILTSSKISLPYKLFSSFAFVLFAFIFMYIWIHSPFNYKSPDSGRLLLIFKALDLVKQGFLFGADNLFIDKHLHIAEIHNVYLAIIGEFGIFVLISYMVYLFWFFRHSSKPGKIVLIYLFISGAVSPAFYLGFNENFYLYLMVIIYLNHSENLKKDSDQIAEFSPHLKNPVQINSPD
jgi:hypothetical protein